MSIETKIFSGKIIFLAVRTFFLNLYFSGSSEDSSAEDVPLRASMASTNGGGHHMGQHMGHDMVGDSIGNNSTNSAIQKQVSTSDDYLLRQVRHSLRESASKI